MTLKKFLFLLSFTAFIALPYPIQAQSLYGDFVKPPTDFRRGFYLGTESGLFFFLGTNGAIGSPGYNVGFYTGYDISNYISIEGRFKTALNGADRALTALEGGIYTIQGNGLIRFSLPINRLFPFVDVGAGIVRTYPTYTNGKDGGLDVEFGYGVEYYTYQRHFSIALRGTYTYINEFPDMASFNFTLKYTF